jgi:hypothetical protein
MSGPKMYAVRWRRRIDGERHGNVFEFDEHEAKEARGALEKALRDGRIGEGEMLPLAGLAGMEEFLAELPGPEPGEGG